MNGPLQRPIAALALALWVAPALAWTPETRVRMVDESIRLMPRSLRSAFEGHRQELLRGMLAPMTASPMYSPSRFQKLSRALLFATSSEPAIVT